MMEYLGKITATLWVTVAFLIVLNVGVKEYDWYEYFVHFAGSVLLSTVLLSCVYIVCWIWS